MAEISSDTCRQNQSIARIICDGDGRCLTRATADIVKSKLANTGVELHQQRQRLTDTTGGTEDGDLGGL